MIVVIMWKEMRQGVTLFQWLVCHEALFLGLVLEWSSDLAFIFFICSGMDRPSGIWIWDMGYWKLAIDVCGRGLDERYTFFYFELCVPFLANYHALL